MPDTLQFPVDAPRSVRRSISRQQARKHARYNGPAPRYEPARDLSCQQHRRKLPCTRCAA